MQKEKEYIVTLNENVDYEQFKRDMIERDATPFIPLRNVRVANHRPASKRNTHYMLTPNEAKELTKDPRVFDVELNPAIRDDIEIGNRASQTGDFSKTTSDTGDFVNWGLRRMISPTNPYTSNTVTGDFTYTLTGEGVDVVIMDSGIQADHPEFQDANGNTRVQQIDWYAASGLTGTMPTGHYTDYDGHGTHCAGIAAGKTYGWAKNARIYAVKLAGLEGTSDPNNGIPITDAFDIIKEWHKRKKAPSYTPTTATWAPNTGVMELTIGLHSFTAGDKIKIAPYGISFTSSADDNATVTAYPRDDLTTETGQDPFYNKELSITAVSSTTITVNTGLIGDTNEFTFESALPDAIIVPGVKQKRQTVVNMSWGYLSRYMFISGGNYRGTAWSGSSKNAAYGMTGAFDGIGYQHPIRVSSVDVDTDELIDAGVNVVIAAGNKYHKVDIEGGVDYNNYYISLLYGTRYYHRGSSPLSPKALMVGNVDSDLVSGEEVKAQSSETGPGVDLYAPGTNIMSATSTVNKFTDGAYPSDSSYRITNISGTSMAAPQVAGLLATYGEINPNATPAQMKVWAEQTAKQDVLDDQGNTDNDYTNYRSLLGGNNLFAFQEFNDKNVVAFAGQETISQVQDDVDPTYVLTVSSSSVDEGQSFTVTLQTTNVVSGTIIPFTITGVTSADISDAALVDNFIQGVTMQKTYTVSEDNLFDDGADTFRLTLNDVPTVQVSVTINDTSKPDPIYSLSASSTNVDEGSTVTFTATAQNVLTGTQIPYTITGIESEDIGGEPLTGNLTVPSDLTRTYTLTADGIAEGQQTMTFNWGSESIDVLINDTSNVPITYSLSPSVTDVDEGGTFTVDISTIGGITGTQIGYTISGVSSVDINNASLTGTYTIGTDTSKSFTVSEDFVTEGSETFRMELDNITPTVFAEVTINDTSTTVVSGSEVITNPGTGTFTVPGGVSNISIMAVGGGAGSGTNSALGAGQLSGGGGSGAVAWLNNISVTAGQVINYTVGAGGAGNNDGGDTTVTVQGVTYTAGGGSASAPTAITGLSPYQLYSGGAGGTASGSWTGSTAGGVGGKSYRSQSGQLYIGGGAGGSGTGGIGQSGYPQNVIDPRNGAVAPSSYTASAPTTNNQLISIETAHVPGESRISHYIRYGGQTNDFFQSNNDEQAYYYTHRWNEWINSISDFGTYDSYYFVFRNADDDVVNVLQSNVPTPLANEFDLSAPTTGTGILSQTHYQFDMINSNPHSGSNVNYNGSNLSANAQGSRGPFVTVQLRGGAATGATDNNTFLIGTHNLLPQGDAITNPNETAGSGGGQGYTQDWASGTGIVVGGTGGATTMSKGLSNTRGATPSTTVSQTISGAGTAIFGGAGGAGNVVSSVSSYAVGAGAGGVGVHALAPSGQRTRAESGTAGGLLIVWPGAMASNQFKAPSYTLNRSKTNCNEGSSFSITCSSNLTENGDSIPFTITGVSSADIGGVSLTQNFTVLNNNKTFNVTADSAFEGTETFNLALDNGGDDINVSINDTSDGTQQTFTANITNSGASAYLFSSATDRNGTISGANPDLVIDQGDTISWTINASGHPFYIKDVQGTGTGNATANVTGQGATNGVISYIPGVDGLKYYQCSSHNDMNGNIYIVNDHWMTIHEDTIDAEHGTYDMKIIAGNDSTSIISWRKRNAVNDYTNHITRYTSKGSPVWDKTYATSNVQGFVKATMDGQNNVYVTIQHDDDTNTFFVQKLDSAGAEVWGRKYTTDNASYIPMPQDITFSANGNVVVTGTYIDSSNQGMFVTTLDSTNGDVINVKRIAPSSNASAAYRVITDTSNNVYLVGQGVPQSATTNYAYLVVWKFNSSLTLQWERYYGHDTSSITNMKAQGITLDHLGNPIIALTQIGGDRSHVLVLNGSTGAVTQEFELDASNRATFDPNIRGITYDSDNNRIVIVGTARHSTATGAFSAFARSFDTSLSNVKNRMWRSNHNGSYEMRFLDCDLDDTLSSQNRMFVVGTGNTSKSTTRRGVLVGSLPFNDDDVSYTDTDIEFDEYRYTEQGTVTLVTSNSIWETDKTLGEVIDNSVITASSGTGEGTLNTALTGWDQQKMALFWGSNTESQEADDPTYSLTSSATTINEGQSFTITLDTTNVPDGTNVPYTITGVSSADIGGVSLTGSFTVLNNSASLTINVTADQLTD